MTSLATYADRVNLGQYERDLSYLKRDAWTQKEIARDRIIQMLRWKRKPLRILTMPGLTWKFEHNLLKMRGRGGDNYTHIYAIERSPVIWNASIFNMPGVADGINFTKFKRIGVKSVASTRLIRSYMLGEFEECAIGFPLRKPFDLAWLDFTGQISERRIAAIEVLWERVLRDYLVITSLYGRWNKSTKARIDEAGSLAAAVMSRLDDAFLMDEYRYADGVAMHQMVIRRAGSEDRRREFARTALLLPGGIPNVRPTA